MLAALLTNLPPSIGEIPTPLLTTFEAWAPRAAEQLGVASDVPPPAVGWRAWARALVAAPSLQGYPLPGPEGFSGWEAWALACKRVYPGA